MPRCLVALVCVLSGGCSFVFDPNPASRDADVGVDAAVDLGAGTWRAENISQTAESMGFHARQAYFEGSRRVVAWAEVEEGSSGSDMDVVAAEHSGTDWSKMFLTGDDQQNSYTDLLSDGDRLYLIWSGRPSADDDYDVFLSIHGGASWSIPVDLTSDFETGEVRDDYRPRAALTEEGELVVAYLSRLRDGSGPVFGSEEVRAQRVAGLSGSEPAVVIPADEDTCSEVVVASGPNGGNHLLAVCGNLSYASGEEGIWSAPRDLEGQKDGRWISPEIVADEDGIHIVYRNDLPCGDGTCGEIFYLRGRDGEFEPPTAVSSTPDVSDLLPEIGVDPWGRILIAYTERADDSDTAYFSYSDDGDSFAQPTAITPRDVVTRDQPADIAFHPGSGLPSIVFLRTFSGSDPLNVDTFVADFEPRP